MNEPMNVTSGANGGQYGVAFALTGLGGSNAFGAGFLQAALDCDVEPRIVSCTSGMIYWTWRYLEARRAPAAARAGRLRREVEDSLTTVEPFPKSGDILNNIWLMTAGVPGIFRWARPEYFARFWTAPLLSLSVPLSDALMNLFLPAQLLVPMRPESDFVEMAGAFNESSIGVCFNSFEAETGTEYLHANVAARAMLEEEDRRMKALRVADESRIENGKPRRRSLPATIKVEIDALGVEDAFWLTLYGPHSNVGRGGPANRLDGAYRRSIILSELTMVGTVLMPRPTAIQRAAFPSNYFESQDFQTELWWNASYTPQVAAIEFVNRLVGGGQLDETEFRRINLVPVEIDVDRGFFLYFREDLETFDRGYNEARATFDRLGLTSPRISHVSAVEMARAPELASGGPRS